MLLCSAIGFYLMVRALTERSWVRYHYSTNLLRDQFQFVVLGTLETITDALDTQGCSSPSNSMSSQNNNMKCSLYISSYAVDYGLSVNKLMFCSVGSKAKGRGAANL